MAILIVGGSGLISCSKNLNDLSADQFKERKQLERSKELEKNNLAPTKILTLNPLSWTSYSWSGLALSKRIFCYEYPFSFCQKGLKDKSFESDYEFLTKLGPGDKLELIDELLAEIPKHYEFKRQFLSLQKKKELENFVIYLSYLNINRRQLTLKDLLLSEKKLKEFPEKYLNAENKKLRASLLSFFKEKENIRAKAAFNYQAGFIKAAIKSNNLKIAKARFYDLKLNYPQFKLEIADIESLFLPAFCKHYSILLNLVSGKAKSPLRQISSLSNEIDEISRSFTSFAEKECWALIQNRMISLVRSHIREEN